MCRLLSLGALTKHDAPVNAPEHNRLLILILSYGCIRCIKSLVNTSILTYRVGWMGLLDALNAPEPGANRFFGTIDAPMMHPIAPSCTLGARA
jgi:hypothetical protein